MVCSLAVPHAPSLPSAFLVSDKWSIRVGSKNKAKVTWLSLRGCASALAKVVFQIWPSSPLTATCMKIKVMVVFLFLLSLERQKRLE